MATDRMAKVTWTGSLMDGSGHDRGRRQRRVRAARRHLGVPHGGVRTASTSPEELIAAAWASCFSMALSHVLAGAGTPPERLETVRDRHVPAGRGDRQGRDQVVGTVSGVDHDGFVGQAEGAKANCPVSKALTGVPEITLDATLADAGR